MCLFSPSGFGFPSYWCTWRPPNIPFMEKVQWNPQTMKSFNAISERIHIEMANKE
uniref:Uncharacterized protein n=1 Tax=Physcomitrium patens TaxID=3218 RepID=A0A2K1J3G1_PHYPA|nr:hypothetical protein PHYPA_021919 [Physcomitrium patens]